MKDISRSGYTSAEIWDELLLKRGTNTIDFRFDVLNAEGQKLAEIDTVEGGNVEFAAFDAIKRKMKITMQRPSFESHSYMTWADNSNREWSDL